MNEHRVPMLGGAWRRRSDPMRSPDPKVRELVSALSALEVAPALRPEFRAELRAQLVAVTPRLVTEGEPVAAPARSATSHAATAPATTRRERHRVRFAKPLIAAACVLSAFVLLLGGAVLLSRHALPGDALYGIKRASENTEYSLTSGSVAKGKLKLDFASRRVGEVADLLPRSSAMAAGTGAVADGGAVNANTASLITDTLASADGDVLTASQLLTSSAVRSASASPLSAITSWSPGQAAALRHIAARIPAGTLHQRVLHSLNVVEHARRRAGDLRADLGCRCLSSTSSDQFGPLPCPGPCAGAHATKHSTRHTNHPATTPRRHQRPGTTPGVRSTAPVGSHTGGSHSTPAGAPPVSKTPGPSVPAGGTTTPGLPVLPTLPGLGGQSPTGGGSKLVPVLPIGTGTCSNALSIGGISVGGGC